MLQHYPSPQGNGTVLLCQSVQQLRRLLPAYYWLGCFLFNFKIFRSKTTEKNLTFLCWRVFYKSVIIGYLIPLRFYSCSPKLDLWIDAFSKRCLWSCMVGLIQFTEPTRMVYLTGHGPHGCQGVKGFKGSLYQGLKGFKGSLRGHDLKGPDVKGLKKFQDLGFHGC